jgi:kojibiose phosphorylase
METSSSTSARCARAGPRWPPEILRPFRLFAFDWDGTAVPDRRADARRVVALLDRLLAAGARAAVITGTSFANVARQLGDGIGRAQARRLFVCANRGSEVFGFDHRGAPTRLFVRQATPEEERALDAAAAEVEERLTRRTGLPFAVVRDRLNRRKIDLIPEPRFRDPPKSALGALLAATEARLRGGGLRAGLAEAVELAAVCARACGLPEARVTSDVKHVEIGLTDKGDAVRFLAAHVVAPLGIAPADVLLAGDEFGPIAGFEGSDHRMLDEPALRGAVAVSVGPEPGGAPPGVLHLGGGPDRFCDLLEEQLALDAAEGVFAVPRDAGWTVEEPGFDVAREHEIEALLAIANGYVGSRASLAEGSSVSRPATFLAGAFEPAPDPGGVPELVVLPDWARLRFTVEGEQVGVETGHMVGHRRVLDLRRGLLLREGTEHGAGGHVTRLRTVHLASLADRHLLVEQVELWPQNYSGAVRVEAVVSGDLPRDGGAGRWAGFVATPEEGTGLLLLGQTYRGLTVALASHLETLPECPRARGCCEASDDVGAERYELSVRMGEPCRLHRAVVLRSSRDEEDTAGAAGALRGALRAEPPERALARHEAAWAARWRRAGVVIDGAPGLERALRFAVYHLVSAANPEDPRCSIGARALTGEAYRGHVFWDTDIFMLPFFAHTYPEAARALVEYRRLTLPGARRKAAAHGYAGALYAWESTDTGDETTPAVMVTPFGEVVRVLCGEQEHHISADVAYGACATARVTGDALLAGPGRTILLETARFWASRATRGPDGLFHIEKVIGPDEYHEAVDDNAFTNWMARFNLRRAARVAEAEEARAFDAIADAMYLGLDAETGLIEQFRGFHALERVDLAALRGGHVPADVVLGRARTAASQVIKQADVVQLVALLWDELAPAVRRRCFLHYEPRTVHTSSLSPGIHALVAARLGLTEIAARYLEQTADIDLGNTMGNAAGGVHAAALGSLWQAVVQGVGGVRPAPDDDEALWIEPHLLPAIRHLGFPLTWRGRQLTVDVDAGAVEVAVEEGPPLTVRAVGPACGASVRAEPGRRYAARRGPEGYAAWEETAP